MIFSLVDIIACCAVLSAQKRHHQNKKSGQQKGIRKFPKMFSIRSSDNYTSEGLYALAGHALGCAGGTLRRQARTLDVTIREMYVHSD